MDLRPILRVVGLLLVGLSGVMLIPAAVDAAFLNPDWRVFVTGSAITAFVGGALIAGTGGATSLQLTRRQAFLLTGLCWLAVPAFGALPLLGLGVDYTDAFFEAISGVTTTGSTVITGLDSLPPGILLWRSLLQWMGGVGIIVMAIVILPFLRIGGMQLFQTESSERSEKVVPGTFQLAAWIAGVYLALSVLCALGYRLTGMSVFDAVNHAMTTVATGGYSTHDASIAHFGNSATQWVGTVFMLAGALPFVMYIRSVQGDWRAPWRDPQAKVLVGFLALVSLVVAVWLWSMTEATFGSALTRGVFNVVSVSTTTGFSSDDYSLWGAPAVGVFLILTFVGGCTGSTSGAIKIYRFQVIVIVVRGQLLRLVSPHRVIAPIYGGRAVPEDVPASVLAFIMIFLATVALFTIVLALLGLDIVTALSASATAIANVGPGLGPTIGPAGNFSTLPDIAKWCLSIAMLLGRLEIFTVLVLFDPAFWRP